LDVPLIMVSHDVEDGMIADRRWRMRRGRIFCASETVLDEDMAWGS
jgi:ABC-type lipoprotein export system ATPase subunit